MVGHAAGLGDDDPRPHRTGDAAGDLGLQSEQLLGIAVEAVETFGKHVLPNYDKDPVHSTQRQREEWLAKQHA